MQTTCPPSPPFASDRQLHGLEAWIRSPHNPPPRWKMAAATLLGVYPTSLFLSLTVGKIVHTWPLLARTLVFAAGMVALLTWVVMPFVAQLIHGWLNPPLLNREKST